MISYVFMGGERGKVQFQSKLRTTSQVINSKKVCEHHLLHQTGLKFNLGNKASATLI